MFSEVFNVLALLNVNVDPIVWSLDDVQIKFNYKKVVLKHVEIKQRYLDIYRSLLLCFDGHGVPSFATTTVLRYPHIVSSLQALG